MLGMLNLNHSGRQPKKAWIGWDFWLSLFIQYAHAYTPVSFNVVLSTSKIKKKRIDKLICYRKDARRRWGLQILICALCFVSQLGQYTRERERRTHTKYTECTLRYVYLIQYYAINRTGATEIENIKSRIFPNNNG